MPFCMAGVALYDSLTCLQTSRKSFCVAGAVSSLQTSQEGILLGKRNPLDGAC